MSETPLFEFTMRYVEKDPEGYYYVRWDRAITTTVIAPSRPEALKRLWAMLGTCPRSGWVWTAHVDGVRQLTPAEMAQDGAR